MKKLLFILLTLIILINISHAQIDASQKLIEEYANTLPEKAEVAIGIIKNGKMTAQGFQKKNGVTK